MDLPITGTTDAEPGQTVTVDLNGTSYPGTVQADGTWSVTVPTADLAGLDPSEVVSADVSDVAGNPAAQATRTLTVDTGAPSIGIDAIATDNILDAAEAGVDLPITGTTDAEAGQTVTVDFNGNPYTGTVQADGTWSVTVPTADLAGLDPSEVVTADVSDVAGNPAAQATRTLTVDTGAPSIGIDAIATDDILNAAEAGVDLRSLVRLMPNLVRL